MLDKKEIRVAAYCRVGHKDNDSMDRQRKVLRDYAAKHGYMNCAEYVENGASGITLDRPAFNLMNGDIRMKHIQAVLVRDVSRISRNYLDLHAWRNDMRERGVRVHSLVDGRIL